MPEGHTIHRLARDLNKTLRPGPVSASSPQGRFAEEAATLNRRPLERADAWGKHLFLDFDGPIAHVHLGLIGKLRKKPLGAPVVGEIRLRLETDQATWDLTGPMICALVADDDVIDIVARLGPDPLRRGADADEFVRRLGRRSVPLAAALLDQTVLAGIGNVFRSELCFLIGVDPTTPANSLSETQARALWNITHDQLKLGERLDRIVTRDPAEIGVSAGRIPAGERLYVYKRDGEPCHRCGDDIVLTEIAKRKAWRCPTCQR
jgi:endonuclease-8